MGHVSLAQWSLLVVLLVPGVVFAQTREGSASPVIDAEPSAPFPDAGAP